MFFGLLPKNAKLGWRCAARMMGQEISLVSGQSPLLADILPAQIKLSNWCAILLSAARVPASVLHARIRTEILESVALSHVLSKKWLQTILESLRRTETPSKTIRFAYIALNPCGTLAELPTKSLQKFYKRPEAQNSRTPTELQQYC